MGRFEGRRLSFTRLGVVVAAAGALAFTSLSGWQWFQDSQAAGSGKAWFAGYADVTVTPKFEFETPSSKADRHVVLSFVVASKTKPCEPSWGAAYSMDDAAKELDLERRIARLRQNGGEPVVSFGGAINDELASTCTNVEKLTEAYRSVVERYDLRVIDLDIEGAALSDTAASERRAKAIAALQAERTGADEDLRVWATLPVAPQGLTIAGRQAVNSLLTQDVDLSGVNVMTMNYGGSRDKNQSMADASISALNSTHDQLASIYAEAGQPIGSATLWKRMGATPMIGQNDVAGERFGASAANELNAFARSKGLGRMSMWSLNRDRPCGANYPDVRVVSDSCSGVDQGGASFATLLARGMGDRPAGAAVTPTVPEPAATATLSDDPATSPYAIWDEDETYVEGTRVVWHRNVYTAKWWTQGDLPDDPTVDVSSSPWQLVGPVLPGEKPVPTPTLEPGSYPTWQDDEVYKKGRIVLYDGIAFRAKWWTQGDNPTARTTPSEPGPWSRLTPAEIRDAAKKRDGRDDRRSFGAAGTGGRRGHHVGAVLRGDVPVDQV